MKSFVFWLSTAAAIGALAGSMGVPVSLKSLLFGLPSSPCTTAGVRWPQSDTMRLPHHDSLLGNRVSRRGFLKYPWEG